MRGPMLMLATLAAACCLAADAPPDPRADPYFAHPLIRPLMEWVTFQLTFDGGTLTPDLAAGESKVSPQGTPRFAPGLKGQALVAGGAEGSGAGIYPRGANAPLETQGAIALWVCPVHWTHVQGGNTVFVMTTNSSFYIQRQGPWIEGVTLKRAEGLQVLMLSKVTGNRCLMYGTKDWPAGQWRLVVANWSWPTMSVSLDGGEFQSATVRANPSAADFGGLVIGATGGEETLVDEVTIFRRPLRLEEVKALYEALRPR
jgi:hypothetical protein